jgi:hypothetical protein
MPKLYPQIDRIEARRCLDEFQRSTKAGFAPLFKSPRQVYSPLGGSRVSSAELVALRESIEAIARATGLPGDLTADKRRRFDRDVGRALHQTMPITAHEASRPGVWQFLCCVVFPDVVSWRFPTESERAVEARFFGGNRNALGRLWWRAEVLRDEAADDPYHLLDALMEDEVVQIMERPSIARCRSVARALARSFIGVFAAKDSRAEVLGRMDLMRDAAKRVLRTGAVIAFDVLNDDQAGAISKIELAKACEALLERRLPQAA